MTKSLIPDTFALLSVIFGGLFARETIYNRELSARVAELQQRLHRQMEQIQTESKEVARLTQDNASRSAKAEAHKQKQIEEKSLAAAALASADVTSAIPPPKVPRDATDDSPPAKANAMGVDSIFGKSLSEMMKDPAMRKMMRSSQEMTLKPMYGDLVKQWNLSPADAKNFYDLLLDKQTAAVEQGQALLAGKGDATALPSNNSDDAIKSALGDTMYEEYKNYEKTLPDRLELNQFKQQLATDDKQALTPDQSNYLVQVLSEERKNSSPNPMFGKDTTSSLADGHFTFDSATVDGYVKFQTEFNARVADRVGGVLTSAQLESFKGHQQQMLDMQKAGVAMAASMFGNKP